MQSNFSLLRDAVSSAIQTFIRRSQAPRKQIQPAPSQESHRRLPVLGFLSCAK